LLYWLLYLKLFHIFPPFRIFRYLTFRTAFASLTALFTGLIIGPLVIKRLREFQIGQFPGGATKGNTLRAHQRDASRVVAAIFHAAQSVQQYRHNWLRPDVSDDSAHIQNPTLFVPDYVLSGLPFRRSTQPSTLFCRPRAIPNAPAGTSSTIDDPAPT